MLLGSFTLGRLLMMHLPQRNSSGVFELESLQRTFISGHSAPLMPHLVQSHLHYVVCQPHVYATESLDGRCGPVGVRFAAPNGLEPFRAPHSS